MKTPGWEKVGGGVLAIDLAMGIDSNLNQCIDGPNSLPFHEGQLCQGSRPPATV